VWAPSDSITFSQYGAQVSGVYMSGDGAYEGTMSGRVFTGRWHRHSLNQSGWTVFTFPESNERSFEGEWGYGDDHSAKWAQRGAKTSP
jgi:hypothetical protein